MRFRSASWSSKRFASALALATGCFVLPLAASATVTITPQSPYGITSNAEIFYHTGGVTGSAFLDTGYSNFDFTQTAATEAGTTRPNMIFFDIFSDKTFTLTGDQKLVITASTKVTSGTDTIQVIPIAYAGGDCVDLINCQSPSAVPIGGVTQFLSARYTQQTTLRVGIYLQDLCAAIPALNVGTQAVGCITGSVIAPSSTIAFNQNIIQFTVGVAASSLATGPITGTGAEEQTAQLKLNQYTGTPTYTCSEAALANAYFPGDSEIIFQTGILAAGAVVIPNVAPIANIIVAINKDAVPVTTSAYATSNTIPAALGFNSGVQRITGFENTTNGTDNAYQMGMSIRDATGVVAAFDTSCNLTNIKTSTIQGFLKKSSCFIATAAFNSGDAEPVVMLREFRDEILLQTRAGSAFVRWYYAWSPAAAEWLLAHPVYRLPVLWALIPVQLLAWLALHPALIGLLLLVSGAVSWRGLRQ